MGLHEGVFGAHVFGEVNSNPRRCLARFPVTTQRRLRLADAAAAKSVVRSTGTADAAHPAAFSAALARNSSHLLFPSFAVRSRGPRCQCRAAPAPGNPQ